MKERTENKKLPPGWANKQHQGNVPPPNWAKRENISDNINLGTSNTVTPFVDTTSNIQSPTAKQADSRVAMNQTICANNDFRKQVEELDELTKNKNLSADKQTLFQRDKTQRTGTQRPQKKRNKSKAPVIAVASVLVVAIVVILFFLFRDNNSDELAIEPSVTEPIQEQIAEPIEEPSDELGEEEPTEDLPTEPIEEMTHEETVTIEDSIDSSDTAFEYYYEETPPPIEPTETFSEVTIYWLIVDKLHGLSDASYRNDASLVTRFINPNSTFYQDTVNLISSYETRYITVTIQEYIITDIRYEGNGRYYVDVTELFSVQIGGRTSNQTQIVTYTVDDVDGVFLVSQIVIHDIIS